MTEQTLRRPRTTAPDPARRAVPDARSATDARSVTRPAFAARKPVHVAVTVGMTASLYAVSLAGVAALQAGTDSGLSADRAPAAAAVATLREAHDVAEARLAQMESSFAAAASTYGEIAAAIGAHEKVLARLGEQVATVEGSAAALRLPSFASLPSVSSRTAVVARPPSNACTTGSGKPC